MTLAQLGADVIRIDPIGGGSDHLCWPVAPDGERRYAQVLPDRWRG